ncbi:HMG1/2-like protein-like isoform X1 [Glycine max]|uniref:HMG1/2-like protein-like isoform X1 n=1 Tax=Glycine max TaxID=3847 RepID=UPI0003DEA7CD|nr:uncharacterized protein LOC100499992 isoform X1 [Glycine max]
MPKAKSDAKAADSRLKRKGAGAGRKQSRKAAKDPNKPKRPPSAFFVFMSEFREQFKKEHPNNKSVAVVSDFALFIFSLRVKNLTLFFVYSHPYFSEKYFRSAKLVVKNGNRYLMLKRPLSLLLLRRRNRSMRKLFRLTISNWRERIQRKTSLTSQSLKSMMTRKMRRRMMMSKDGDT